MATAETSQEPEEPDQPAALARPHSVRDTPQGVAHLSAGEGTNSSIAADKLFTRPFVALLGMQAAYGSSFSMFFLLPKYLAAVGETPSRIGLVMGGFGVACILTIPFLPGIIRLCGRRGALMAATLLLAAAGAMFAVLTRPGWAAVVLRAAEGVTWTIMFSTSVALTAEMAPRDRLAQAIGLAGGASLIMNAVAPAIGEPLADRFGYRPAFLLAAVAALMAAALARRLPVSDKAPGPGSVRATPGHRTAGPAPSRLSVYVVFALGGLAFSVMLTFLAPFALAAGVHAIRAFFIAYTCAALAVRVLGGRLSDRLGHASVAGGALLVYGLVIASTGFLGAHHLVLLGIGFGLAHGAAFPALMALLVTSTAPERRPRTLGIANGAMSLGISAVFPAGMLVKPLGYVAMFALAGGLTATSAALIWRRKRAPQR